MEEEKNFVEQSSSLETETTSTDASTFEGEMATTSTDAKRGEPIGRFSSAEELLTAYNNLQSEFTRKSQRLAALEKENATDEQTENGLKAFLSKTPEAFSYADQLKKLASSEPSQTEDVFAKAWTQILYAKLSGEDTFKNMILHDKNVKNMVIEDYVEQLQKRQSPIVMSKNSGARVSQVSKETPNSFEAAKRAVLDMFDD